MSGAGVTSDTTTRPPGLHTRAISRSTACGRLKWWKAARDTLNGVVQNFPGTNAATLAAQRLQRMQDEGH